MPPRDPQLLQRALESLRPAEGHLYGVLDGARSTRVLSLLRKADDEHASLYEGLEGEVLAPFGPFLVQLRPGSRLLSSVLEEGWGRSWGIFLHTTAAFRHVRRHLRRFLMVTTGSGTGLYFRFYDPRVLRVFLPSCTPRQSTMLFAEVRSFLMEGDEPTTLLRFHAEGTRLSQEAVSLVQGGA